MVVQHNITAMNANRMLGITTGQQAKSSEKLSSGYRINRAADDAAGLTISEKMRKQIKGLTQASTNAQDGVSAVQTAEGALTEVHSMLQRMNELATQAANGTNSKSDRQAIQDEITQLETEIDRVAETTKFNETYLLKGDGTQGSKTLKAHDAGLKGDLTDNGDGTSTFCTGCAGGLAVGDKVTIGGTEYSIVDSADVTDYQDLKGYTAVSGDKLVSGGKTYTYFAAADPDVNGTAAAAAGWYENGDSTTAAYAGPAVGDTLVNGGKSLTLVGDGTNAYTAKTLEDVAAEIKKLAANGTVDILDETGKSVASYKVGLVTDIAAGTTTIDDILKDIKGGQNVKVGSTYYYTTAVSGTNPKEISLNDAYDKMKDELLAANTIGTDANTADVTNNGDGSFTIKQGTVAVDNGLSFSLHVGADADMTNKINVNIDSMSAAGLGIKGIGVADLSGAKATYAIDAIADAIATVSSQRSALGAVQNRLEHTIANLDNVVENTTAAESRIRDTDMAKEMVEYSKNNILAQAGQSMLAQANQSTQGVLSLLQ